MAKRSPAELGGEKPQVQAPKLGEPKAGDPRAAEARVGEPRVGEPRVGEPRVGEPRVGEPRVGEPKVGEPKVGEPKVGEPKVGESKVGEPKVGEPKVGEPKVGEPKVGEPKVGEPKVGEPKVGEPKVGEPGAAEATAGEPKLGWRRARPTPTLAESYRTISVEGNWWRKLLAFAGPGYLVAVGYMDPGNWATDLAGGARFGYILLSVILISNLLAVLLQGLASKLGIVTGRDLAQACRDSYSRPTNYALWLFAEVAIAACDLAEVIGSAIALNLLFHIPLLVGVIFTSLDVLIVLYLQHTGFRRLEALVVALIATIGLCFLFEMVISRPDLPAVLSGFVPSAQIVRNPAMLYIAISILGATVMPHNLYLHSSIVQTRRYAENTAGRREAVRFAFLDSTIALTFALFINAAILIVAAASFHTTGHSDVAEIQDAYKLLTPLLGVGGASLVFALALLASGQNSTLTGTLAGQIVMEGFLNVRLRPWLRRLITRGIAIIPAIIATALYGEHGTATLLVFSQVVLSLQLSFAVVPLVQFTSNRAKMGEFVNARWLTALSWFCAILIAGLNAWLIVEALA